MPSHTKHSFSSSVPLHTMYFLQDHQELQIPICGFATTGELSYNLALQAPCSIDFILVSLTHALGQRSVTLTKNFLYPTHPTPSSTHTRPANVGTRLLAHIPFVVNHACSGVGAEGASSPPTYFICQKFGQNFKVWAKKLRHFLTILMKLYFVFECMNKSLYCLR